jgi:hypothetical protein
MGHDGLKRPGRDVASVRGTVWYHTAADRRRLSIFTSRRPEAPAMSQPTKFVLGTVAASVVAGVLLLAATAAV